METVKSETLKPAAILCGGRATRLGELTAGLPKALLPCCGHPFLELLLEKLRREGFSPLIVITGHLHEQIADFAKIHRSRFKHLHVMKSSEGTAPAVKRALRHCRVLGAERMLCLNGDTILDVNYSEVFAYNLQSDADVSIVSTTSRTAPNKGAVLLEDDRVIAFLEGASECERGSYRAKSAESNCGCYVLRVDRCFQSMKSAKVQSFEMDVMPRLVSKLKVNAYRAGDRFFLDFGTRERLRMLLRCDGQIRRIYGIG